jgi:hypothetical protein
MKKIINRFEIDEFSINEIIFPNKKRVKLILSIFLNYMNWNTQTYEIIKNDINFPSVMKNEFTSNKINLNDLKKKLNKNIENDIELQNIIKNKSELVNNNIQTIKEFAIKTRNFKNNASNKLSEIDELNNLKSELKNINDKYKNEKISLIEEVSIILFFYEYLSVQYFFICSAIILINYIALI